MRYPSAMAELVLTSIRNHIATITMNRPDKRNALSPELIVALGDALDTIEADPGIRVTILAGAGRSFCAGMDLRGVLQDPVAMAGMLRGLARVTRRIRRLPMNHPQMLLLCRLAGLGARTR